MYQVLYIGWEVSDNNNADRCGSETVPIDMAHLVNCIQHSGKTCRLHVTPIHGPPRVHRIQFNTAPNGTT
jgi:hypothetical protein